MLKTTGRQDTIVQTIFLVIVTFMCYWGIYWRKTTKIDNYTTNDVKSVRGTLKEVPTFETINATGGSKLIIRLNEYHNKEFYSSGIYLQPLNHQTLIYENKPGDSIDISVLTTDYQNDELKILEIKTAKRVYLNLDKLNKNLNKERPLQTAVIYIATFILTFVSAGNIVRLCRAN